QAVLKANKATKVILVAHGTGGLGARAYLQGLARLDSSSTTIAYRHDVAQLITLGAPHLGSPLALICQTSYFGECFENRLIDLKSTAVIEITPGSTALATLNDVASHPLPPEVEFVSLVGLGGVGLAGDGDGLVTRASQSF